MDELGHSTTKRKCHISCRCFVYSRPNIRLLGNIWKIQCSFHCTDNCWQCYRLFLYVYVSIPFKPFCGQIIKVCSVGGVTSHWPQKLIFPATKYTAPANEVVITERACSAEVTPSGDKGRGRGPSWESRAIIPKCVCLPADPHLVRTERWQQKSLCASSRTLSLRMLGYTGMQHGGEKGIDKIQVWFQSPHLYAEWFYLFRSNHYNPHFTKEERASSRNQMRSCILKQSQLVLFLGCHSNLNIISLILPPTFLVINRNCSSLFWEERVKGRFYFCKFYFIYLFLQRSQ